MSFREFSDGNRDESLRGVSVGIVTDNKDPEGLGRVKLTFPWRDTDDESYWARIATLMAGPDRGTFFLPEVSDEVLVAFEDGDIRHPYVIGALWNGEDTPPTSNSDGKNDIKGIKSRGGHEIVFDDADSAGTIEIKTSGGHRVVLDDSGGGKIDIEDGKNTIKLDSGSGTISISGSTKISVEAPTLEMKGNGNVNIEAAGILTLKGSLVNIN